MRRQPRELIAWLVYLKPQNPDELAGKYQRCSHLRSRDLDFDDVPNRVVISRLEPAQV